MDKIGKYKILEKVEVNRGITSYKAESHENSQKVILKVLTKNFPTNSDIDCLSREFEIAKNFPGKGIPNYYFFEKEGEQPFLVVEDFGGISLKKFIELNKINTEQFLEIGIGICEILEQLHQKNIIHKNLNTYNIWINPDNGEIKLMDFAICSYMTKERKKVTSPSRIEGHLEYISPEQTGRVNRTIDYRSDMYSLGVTLYEVLTGSKPFYSFDTMELVHFHIAKSPVPPHFVSPDIPSVISDIILKLMSKNAEDRYHAASGIKYDLTKCLKELRETEKIHPFRIAQKDFSSKLQIPEKLYGRKDSLDTLLQIFEKTCKGSACMVSVEGHSGVGKSALVHEIQKPVAEKRGYFIEGKFNQFNSNVPYFAFISAFKDFIDFILSDSQGNLGRWKSNLEKSLGSTGRVLTEVIPSLQLLLGDQPEVPPLPPSETQNRFNYVCRNFIKTIAKKEHPLIIFIDDVQWADTASLDLMKNLMTDVENLHFMLICSYRVNEVSASHPFSTLIQELELANVDHTRLILSNLSYENVLQLLSESLRSEKQHVESLAKLIFEKTLGNAFFVNEFLKSLYEESLLHFDFGTRTWKWDIEKINGLNIAENVIELMVDKIQKLPTTSQYLLKIASCLGNSFSLSFLQILSYNKELLHQDIANAIRDGLIVAKGDGYKFSHDKVQQAIYSLTNNEEKKEFHLHIGRVLLAHLNKQEIEEHLFSIANQFSLYVKYIHPDEQEKVMSIFLAAGRKAKNSAAYRPSLEYFKAAISMLKTNCWEEKYNDALTLYSEASESAYLCGDNKLMEHWVDLVLKNSKTPLDKVKVYEIRIRSYIAESKLYEAVDTSLLVLNLLDIQFPQNPDKLDVVLALSKIKVLMRGRSYECLLHLPLIENPSKEAAIRIISTVGSATYFAYPKLFPLFVCKAFYLILKHGNSTYSGFITASFGIIMVGAREDFSGGFQLAQIALKLMEIYPLVQLRCRSLMIINSFLIHWNAHKRTILQPLVEAYKSGLETGDFEFASYAAFVYCFSKFFCGAPLSELGEEMQQYATAISQLQQKTPLLSNYIFTQTVLNLRGESEDPTLIKGTAYDEDKEHVWDTEVQSESLLFDFLLCKIMLCYIFGKYDKAVKFSLQGERSITASIGNSGIRIFYFYQSLSLLADEEGRNKNRVKYFKLINRNLKKIEKFSRAAPVNNQNKLALIKAELCRVKGQYPQATLLYEDSINLAKKNEYLNEEALAYEVTSRFYFGLKKQNLGDYFLQKAYNTYYRWGALGKVRDLEKNFHTLKNLRVIKGNLLAKDPILLEEKSLQQVQESEQWDLSSIMKASIAISGEIRMEKLLEKLIHIAIENAGAEKGFLILLTEDRLLIKAEGSVNSDTVTIHENLKVADNELIPEAVIQYVYLTRENLIIDDGLLDTRFGSDKIVVGKKIKSILCIPIINHGNFLGILYFENNLVSGAFTQPRAELLKILSSQMAVSLENAINEERRIADFKEREGLLKKINAQQKMITKAVIQTQEFERKRIAEDLHDGLGYLLSTLKLNLSSLSHAGIEKEGNPKFLANSLNLLEESFKELKTISNDLMPDILFNYGLVKAVEDLCVRINSTGKLNINFRHFNIQPKLKKDFEIEVFRVLQEIINNVVKHAEAQHLEIQFVGREDQLIVTAEDDGKGFDFKTKIKSKKKGKGLINILNRVKFLNGDIKFETPYDKGTTIILHLPLT